MIGKLKGTLTEVDGNVGFIETTGGVFYKVFLSSNLLAALIPSPIEIYTYLQVREDALVLFGFKTKEEYRMFELLLSVSGVGPKTAYGVISYSKVPELVEAIKANDVNFFTKVPGLGKKTAMKIILELSQKMNEAFKMEKMYVSEDDKTVIEALVALGFKSQDAKTILTKIPANLSVEQKITEGLKIGSHKK